MRYLSLYIDKWYIVGAIIDQSGTHKINLSNNEDRIWLYFRNNVNENIVEYGLSFKEAAISGELNYYCDIFNLIPSSEEKTYKSYGLDTDMRNIFSDAGIFSDLKKEFEISEKIPTYLSFSQDVSILAQTVFLELLKEQDFDIEEYVAAIDILSIEYLVNHKQLDEKSFVLVANATNENFYYSIYLQNNSTIECKTSKCLKGYGNDLRTRSLLVQVVNNINDETGFLSNNQEREEEYLYLSQYVNEWLQLLDKTPSGEPTPLGLINLKKQKGNRYSISVLKDDIDKHTSKDADNIVREMIKAIKDSGIGLNDINAVLFIGDSFGNNQYRRALEKHLIDANFIHIRESQLAEVVSVYTSLPSDMFDTAEANFKRASNNQLEQALAAKKRREQIAEAKKKEEADRIANAKRSLAEKSFQILLTRANDAELECDFEESLDLYKKALVISPDNIYIQEKIDDLNNALIEIRTKNKQYNTYLLSAKEAFKSKDWDVAITQSQMAINVKPDSEEAKRIRNEAERQKDKYALIKEWLIKVDTFLEQKDYIRAHREIENITLLGITDQEIEKRRDIIFNALSAREEKINLLVKKLDDAGNDNDYKLTISLCEELITIDTDNVRKWTEKIEWAKNKQEELIALNNKLNNLLTIIYSYQSSAQWVEVMRTCNEYLSLKDNCNVSNILNEASKKLEDQTIQNIINDSFILLNKEEFDKSLDVLKTATQHYPDNLLLKNKYQEYSTIVAHRKEKISLIENQINEAEKQHDYIKAIELCKELIEYDDEHKNYWQLRLQTLQALQIEKNELEINFRRKRADLMVLIRRGDSSAEEEVKKLKAKYHNLGIYKFDSAYSELLKLINPHKYMSDEGLQEEKNIDKKNKTKKKGGHNKKQKEHVNEFEIPQTEGFSLLKQGKFKEAKRQFATIERNTEMSEICSQLIRLRNAQKNGLITPIENRQLKELYNKYNVNY